MATFKNYDPSKVIVTFKGIQVQGYAESTFVKASRAEETFKTNVGAGGDVVRVRNRNRMGTVVVTLQMSSPTNDLLQAIATQDEITGDQYGSLQIKDLNGTTYVTAEKAWIQKPADAEFGADSPNREWSIDCAELVIKNGGSVS